MVRDGYFYALGMAFCAAVFWWMPEFFGLEHRYHTGWHAIALIPILLALFFMWFFRDPVRFVPTDPGLVVSPGDGKVTSISQIELLGQDYTRVSIFLNVFNVHVNRSPIAGTVKEVQYQRGRFANAMGASSADVNEQNIVTIAGEDRVVVFKQIAGLLARRIVFTKTIGDQVGRGERIGLIKFGSRVDVMFPAAMKTLVRLGEHVQGGETVVAADPASPYLRKPASR